MYDEQQPETLTEYCQRAAERFATLPSPPGETETERTNRLLLWFSFTLTQKEVPGSLPTLAYLGDCAEKQALKHIRTDLPTMANERLKAIRENALDQAWGKGKQ